jgi:hypothetical protein
MNAQKEKNTGVQKSIMLLPAFIVLIGNIALSFLFGDILFEPGLKVTFRILLRFIRFTVLLCLPLYLLLPFYHFIIKKMRRRLVAGKINRDISHSYLFHWFYKPFQGIGISFLFGGKLIAILTVKAFSLVEPISLIPKGKFNFGLFVLTTAVTIAVALLLSLIWTLDETGIRYINRKKIEMNILGKYLETITPFLFGMFGIFNLLSKYSIPQASLYIFQIIIILYPPFLVFSVFHSFFIHKRMKLLTSKTKLKKGGVWSEGE